MPKAPYFQLLLRFCEIELLLFGDCSSSGLN
jgi:hypothetical protein